MTDAEQTERLGVSITSRKILEAGHIFREQPIPDFGIDVQIEIKDGATATGRLIAVQIKSGPSYFAEENESGFWHRIENRHRDLWLNHSLPVILVLCDVDSDVCYYEIVNNETCVRAGNNWKILVPKNKILSAASKFDLVSIASPIVAASDYSIHKEEDISHALARRISLDIVAHPGYKAVNRPMLGAIVRAALKKGQSSQYHRDEISQRALRGRPVDVVFGYVYLRDIDRESASWACRFLWISPSLDAHSAPQPFSGEQDGSGLIIDWNGNADLPRLLDQRRATKADYLKSVDWLLKELPDIREKLSTLNDLGDESPDSPNFPPLAEKFQNMWDGSFAAPKECQRLDRAIAELLAIVGNAGFIWDQRNSRDPIPVRSIMKRYQDDLARLDAEISFLRREVR